jgi:hypothetical protein
MRLVCACLRESARSFQIEVLADVYNGDNIESYENMAWAVSRHGGDTVSPVVLRN